MLIKKPEKSRIPFSLELPKLEERMSSQLEKPESFDDALFQHSLPQYYRVILLGFKKVVSSYVRFHCIYLFGFVAELILFFSFFPLLIKSAVFALSLGVLFLTCFSYFVLLFYYQAKKPEELLHLKDRFLDSCRQILPVSQGEVQHHLSIADALSKLAAYLQDFELYLYKAPIFQKTITRFCAYFFGEDVLKMKLLLIQQAIDEHLKQIRITPTDLEVHASLASTYVSLSKVYRQVAFEKQYREAASLAIEEFTILSHYAPNDPWVHEQLASGYRDLEMPVEEIREVEILFSLRPSDKEVLYRLGSLYFKQGMNAKGLQIYEELKKGNFKKAEDLIASYGDYSQWS